MHGGIRKVAIGQQPGGMLAPIPYVRQAVIDVELASGKVARYVIDGGDSCRGDITIRQDESRRSVEFSFTDLFRVREMEFDGPITPGRRDADPRG